MRAFPFIAKSEARNIFIAQTEAIEAVEKACPVRHRIAHGKGALSGRRTHHEDFVRPCIKREHRRFIAQQHDRMQRCIERDGARVERGGSRHWRAAIRAAMRAEQAEIVFCPEHPANRVVDLQLRDATGPEGGHHCIDREADIGAAPIVLTGRAGDGGPFGKVDPFIPARPADGEGRIVRARNIERVLSCRVERHTGRGRDAQNACNEAEFIDYGVGHAAIGPGRIVHPQASQRAPAFIIVVFQPAHGGRSKSARQEFRCAPGGGAIAVGRQMAEHDIGAEQPVLARFTRFVGDDRGCAFDDVGRPACGQSKGTGHDDGVPAAHLVSKEQRNAEPGFLDRNTPKGGTFDLRRAADQAAEMATLQLIADVPDVLRIVGSGQRAQHQLTDLFLHRHDVEQVFDEAFALCAMIGWAECHSQPVSALMVNIRFGFEISSLARLISATGY